MAASSLADICREAGPAYRQLYGDRMLPSHLRALSDFAGCRTEALGGHVYSCQDCGELEYAYHSCRNRHCPRCQGDAAGKWAESVGKRLLPGGYFLLTFTIPAELRPLARANQKLVYSKLLREAAASVLLLANDPQWIGGRPAIANVLHTWARDLTYHPHVHLLVTAGGLSPDGAWKFPPRRKFFIPGRILSPIFRAKIRDALSRAGLVDQVKKQTWTRPWVVHVQDAGRGKEVLSYLSRYIYRVAISDDRIESFDRNQVTFAWWPRGEKARRLMTLPVNDFLARFLQHVLPKRFVKVRYFGLLAPNQHGNLETARRLLMTHQISSGPASPETQSDTTQSLETVADSSDTSRSIESQKAGPVKICRTCGKGVLMHIAVLPRRRRPP